jgi:hypothetical protein
MSFVLGLLGVIVGFVIVAIILCFMVNSFLHKYGLSGKELKRMKDTLEEEEASRHKEVGGMTNVFLPQILKDFKEFNLDEIYLLTEKSLRTIFNAIEKKDMTLIGSKDFNMISKKMKLQLEDLIDSDIIYKYDDIIFHKHVIRSYENKGGVAKLEIASSLEYYFTKEKNKEVLYENKYKDQVSYVTTFVYIADETAYSKDIDVYGLNCPNCGAVVRALNKKECSYCHTGLNIRVVELLKCWKLIDYKQIS